LGKEELNLLWSIENGLSEHFSVQGKLWFTQRKSKLLQNKSPLVFNLVPSPKQKSCFLQSLVFLQNSA